MPFPSNSTPTSYKPPSSGGYGGYYNPTSPQFYNPKEPYNHKQPSNPQLPRVTPGDPTSPPKPITKTPYPNLKQPVNIPKLPTLPPLKSVLPPGGGAIAPRGILPGGGIAAGGGAAGLAAGAALLWGYNFYQLHKLWGLSQPESTPQERPEIPSTVSGIPYEVSYRITITYSPDRIRIDDAKSQVYAPIAGIRFNNSEEDRVYQPQILCRGRYQDPRFPDTPYPDLRWVNGEIGYGSAQPAEVVITGITRLDGETDPTPQNPPQRETPPLIFKRDAAPTNSPSPTTQPPTPQPNPAPQLSPNPQKPPIRLEIPNNQPLTFTSPGNPPLVINQVPPKATPEQPKLPEQPTEIKFPRNTPLGQPQPIQIKSPGQGPITFNSPGNTPITLNVPGFQPIIVDPKNTSQPIGATPQLLVPGSFVPNPLSPTPTKPTAPTKPTKPEPEPELPNVLIPAAILAGLTPLLQQIVNNTSPNSLEPLVSAGVCKTTQPGGCMSNLVNDNTNKINQNLNNTLGNGLNNISNLANLTLLPIINTKLGDQVPGGISGFLGRFAKSIHLDKILNALTLITVLHNASMLSRNLASTLGDAASQALSVIGLKDENDAPIDINEILAKQTNSFIEGLIGAEAWRGVRESWNKANSIISSASQIVFTVRSLFDSGREVTEWIANNTGRIGNALKRFRIVGENAYPHMSENVTHQNAFLLKVERYREGVDNLDDAASSLQGVLGEVQNIQQEFGELQEQKQRFDKAITDATPKTIADNAPVKAAREAALAASKTATTVIESTGQRGEVDNA